MKRFVNKKQILIVPFIFIFSNIFAQTFTEQTSIVLPGLSNGSAVFGDYDNDGDMDILISGLDAGGVLNVKISRNNGSFSYAEQLNIFSPAVPTNASAERSVAKWVDFDNDGLLDILINFPSSSGGSILIYRNEGNNTFLQKSVSGYWTWQGNSVDCGDYDNDGDQDFLIITNNTSKIFQNQGNFVFTELTSILLDGLTASSCKFGDYDNDGNLDIIITGFTALYNSTSRIYKNTGNNSFTLQPFLLSTGDYNGSSEWGDYNNDGLLDVVITGSSGTYLYKNNGNNTFSSQYSISLRSVVDGTAKWGDIDNDGDLDLFISGNESNTYVTTIYLNNGNNTFTELTGLPFDGVYQSSVDLCDYDNDGDLDVLLTGNKGFSKITKVYKNNWLVTNALPAAPTGLTSTVSGNDIILKWGRVTTDNTQAKSITYNVMAGTSSGGVNLVSPGSSSAGFHRISGMGNGQLDTTFILRNIKKGSYFWKVQAIDNSFKGGAFSTESTFTYSASIQSEGLNVQLKDGNTATLAWSRGNGTNCIVFMKEVNTGTASPVNSTSYTASAAFKSGTQLLSTGWYCVYKGTLSTVNVTNLKANSDYIFQVFEYDGNPGAEIYNTTIQAGNPFTFKTGIFTELKSANLQPVTSLSFNNPSKSFWIDFDNDNDLDALLQGPNFTKLYRNDGAGIFTLLATPFVAGYSAACGDYNNDGFIDIAISGDPTLLYKNNGNGTFTEQVSTTLPGTSTNGTMDWGDFDNDGDLDIAMTGESVANGRTSKIFRNNGNNTFTEQQSILLAGLFYGITKFVDYDNDGFLDLIISGGDK